MDFTPFCKHANHTSGLCETGRVGRGGGGDGLKCDQPLAPAQPTVSGRHRINTANVISRVDWVITYHR